MAGIEIDGKKLETIKDASEETGYSRDYITRLAREGKIVASQIGRQWYVDLDSLKQYEAAVAEEQKERQQKLSDERKEERRAYTSAATVSTKRHVDIAPRARRAVGAAVALGVMVGSVLHFSPLHTDERQAASAPLIATMKSEPALWNQERNDASVFENTPPASVVIRELPQVREGTLVLPYSSTTEGSRETEVQDFFSDEVSTLIDEDGQTYLVRFDEEGKLIEKIPYTTEVH